MKLISLETVLETGRLSLRRPLERGIAFIFEATRYPGFNDGMMWDPPERPEECQIPYENAVKAWQAGERYTFTVELKGVGVPVGRLALEQREHGVSAGYWTHPKHQNYGYMTEALEAALRLAFGALELRSVEARHADWNLASRRVLEKCGFRFRKRIEHGLFKRGEWVPEDVLWLTFAQWRHRRAGLTRPAGSAKGR